MISPALLLSLLTTALGLPSFLEKKAELVDLKPRNTLRLVTVVMRHGDRAPATTYPNDPYIHDKMEPYGWGQLTKEGRQNQYNQGHYLRERYDQFLGSIYHPDVFHLQSTDVDRTKMSCQLEAASLWKPVGSQTFKVDLPWQPVVSYFQEISEDTWHTCPRFVQLRSTINDLPTVQKMTEDNKQLLDKLTNFTGMPITNADDAASLYSTLVSEEKMGLSLPEWTKLYYPDKLLPLTLYSLSLNTYTDEMCRLKGGPLLKSIATEMFAKKKNITEPPSRKMFMYVGHDSTVIDLLNTMGVWHDEVPHFNIMTIIELHEEENEEWNVRMYLRNTTIHEPYPLIVPGCTAACPLDKFVEILRPMIPDDWEEECKIVGDFLTPPAPLP